MDSSLFFRFCATVMVNIFIKLYRNFRFHEEDRITDASSSASLSLSYPVSSLSRNWTYHVFPSFHGADVRKNFLSHIQKEFRRKGIDQFLDDHIERSKSIGPELVEAIRGSKIAIVLFSKNYASSSWCLNELVEIMNCREKLGQIVMTVFYEVDPTDVKKQKGSFGKVFTETCKGKTKEEIMRWIKALEGASTIAGEHSRNWDNEATMIEKITTDVSNMLNNSTPSRDLDGFVGMEDHMENMRSLLRPDLDEVRMVGIWGPSGIGKTTIARFLFDQVSSSFQLSTIMVNIKGCYPKPCLDEYSTQLKLQEKMLSQMINQKDIMVPHLGVAQERLKNKKVFLVLDDVDRLRQLEAMAKEISWFGPGSRIIITTEDIRVLKAHGITNIYRVNYPHRYEAFQIFNMYAFGQKEPYNGFSGLAWEAMELAGELPLGLEVLGSYLRGMSGQEWVMELPRLKTCLDGEIESVLKFSYDSLYGEDKDLFLYIACFFNYENTRKVENHLAKRFLDVKRGICILAEKSLIDIRSGEIQMHNLLVRMGREIARKQYYEDPRKLYFLVDQRDIYEAFSYDTIDSKRVIGIDLDLFMITDEVNMSEKALERMSNLQFLRFNGSKRRLYAIQGLSYRHTKIRYLHWKHFPLICFPSTLNPEFLIELFMPNSNFHKLWEGTKPLKNLKWMDLSNSKNLKELPDLSTATNLEELILKNCSSLVELPSSIKELMNLKSLCLSGCSRLLELHSFHENVIDLKSIDLTDCSSLINLPSSIGNAINLHKLSLERCSRLVELPYSIENFTNLKELNLRGCSKLVELPSSIGNLTSFKEFELRGCSSLVELPSSIGNLTSLEEFDLYDCSSLVELPFSIGNLTSLKGFELSGCSSLVELPSSIGNLTSLEDFDLNDCTSLVELPSSIGNLTSLKNFELRGCSSLVELPTSIGNLTSLEVLGLNGCYSLVELPSSLGNLTSLKDFELSGCSSIVEFPSCIGNLNNLKEFDLTDCTSLVELPSSIGNLTHLEKFYLNDCTSLVELPCSIGNLTSLKNFELRGCSSLVELPSSIGNLTSLEKFDLCCCSSLVELPISIGNLTHLEFFYLSGCSSLVELPLSIGNMTNLKTLILRHCSSLVKFTSLANATNLQILDLSNCSNLVEISSTGNTTNLQQLNLNNCSSLVTITFSLRNSTNLEQLDLDNCSSIVELPSIENATNLLEMKLINCSNLLEFPGFIGLMNNLQKFSLYNCSSLVELPFSVGNLRQLHILKVVGCKKLEVLPDNINLESLEILNLTDCSQLKRFPEISTNIKDLHLAGTAIEEVPSSIESWSRLNYLSMQYFGNLKKFPHAFDIITELHMSEDVQEVAPWIKEISRLSRIVLNNCKKLVLLPQLPDSLSHLDAGNCDSLERLDCSFNSPEIRLNFTNCFKLNNDARELVMQTSNHQYVILPGRELPALFNHRATGCYLTVNLNQKPLRTPLRFKACFMLAMIDDETSYFKNSVTVDICINGFSVMVTDHRIIHPVLTEHLYTFEVELAEEKMTSTELVFKFVTYGRKWKIRECGVSRIEVPS